MNNHQHDYDRAVRHVWYAVALIAALLCALVGTFITFLWMAS